MKDDYVRNLLQQVMSPAISNGKVIPIMLNGPLNFTLWLKRIYQFISITSSQWREYVDSGDLGQSISGRNLDAGDVARVKEACDQGLYLIITNSVSSEINEVID